MAERNYETIIERTDRRGKRKYHRAVVRGLKIVHIGEDVWRIGNVSEKNGKRHVVIYGPNRKEYHLYDEEIDKILSDGKYRSDYNNADHGKVKVYILTSILDDKENWCFDLMKIPEVDQLTKVIYENGTVKNILFSGKWEPAKIGKYNFEKKPVGYRLK